MIQCCGYDSALCRCQLLVEVLLVHLRALPLLLQLLLQLLLERDGPRLLQLVLLLPPSLARLLGPGRLQAGSVLLLLLLPLPLPLLLPSLRRSLRRRRRLPRWARLLRLLVLPAA